MIGFRHSGNFNNTERFFERNKKPNYKNILDKYGKMGVEALKAATPVDTGLTAASWDYEIQTTKRGTTIIWTNSHIVDGAPIAILLQYGHGTNNGGYVQGRDYINPAIRSTFDKLAIEIWQEVLAL